MDDFTILLDKKELLDFVQLFVNNFNSNGIYRLIISFDTHPTTSVITKKNVKYISFKKKKINKSNNLVRIPDIRLRTSNQQT
jgi:hypothetical protein